MSGKFNPYAMDFRSKGFDFKAIEDLDSDGDSMSNIDEIRAMRQPGVKNE